MFWKEIKKNEVDEWNEKLKKTSASFFQYPYYASGYSDFFFSKSVYLKLVDEQNIEHGFCTILKISLLFIKIALIIRGPVFFSENIINEGFNSLKRYARNKHYTFLRINSNNSIDEEILKADNEFTPKNYFTFYNGSQDKDFNVYTRKEDDLLKSFRTDCRNKIRFASDLDFEFSTVSSIGELKDVYKTFKELGQTKSFSYRPFKSYKTIFEKGSNCALCSVYQAKYKGDVITSIFMVKDSKSFNCLSGATVLKQDLKPKYSPANKLHYIAMQDCFYKEGLQQYNLSYSAPGSGVHMFKDSFHPEIQDKPAYYTFIIDHKTSSFLLQLQQNKLKKIKASFRSITNKLKK